MNPLENRVQIEKGFQKASEVFWARENACRTPSEKRYQLTISDELKFLWFRNAKVGTRSTLAFFQNAGVNFSAEQAHRCYYPPALYQDYFRFAFVRNPWIRLVSAWRNKVVTGRLFGASADQFGGLKTFKHFVDFCEAQDLGTCNVHIRKQSCLIDLNNVDYLGRLETYEQDLTKIAGIIGLEKQPAIPHKNASKKPKPWRDFYTDDLRDRVGELYRQDVQIFGYKFD